MFSFVTPGQSTAYVLEDSYSVVRFVLSGQEREKKKFVKVICRPPSPFFVRMHLHFRSVVKRSFLSSLYFAAGGCATFNSAEDPGQDISQRG